MSKDAEVVLEALKNEIKNMSEDCVDFTNVTSGALNMREERFKEVLRELETAGLVKGITWDKCGGYLLDDIEIETPDYRFHK